MERASRKLSLLRPVRLRLKKPLEGPYARLLRRSAPEVEALGRGECLVVVRAARVREPVPLLPAPVACYRRRGRGVQKADPDEFSDPVEARRILESGAEGVALRHLAVPVGHICLPDIEWVSRLTARLTPWREEVIEGWRRRIKRGIWMSVLRIYLFDPIVLDPPVPVGEQPAVSPFRVGNLRPVLEDKPFSTALDSLLEVVEEFERKDPSAFARSAQAKREPLLARGGRQPAYSLDEMAAETGFGVARLRGWKELLQRKKQVILYGPPGTGKTFLAERLARQLVGETGGFCELVQFHASYAYEDFVQGIRPLTRRGNVVYEIVPGRFLDFCRRASAVAGAPCVMIIDEINRAQLSRVFGEVMYLLEYRERALPLATGGDLFQIPANVLLIGTMNTADRSIALVDQALRRRFAFIRLRPDLELLGRFLAERGCPAGDLLDVLRQINRRIGDPDRELGISFFMVEGDDLRRNLAQIWEGEIEPYLEEVFYDRPEELEDLRWERLVEDRLERWK